MPELVLAFDLGTGGCKASVWNAEGECLARHVESYPTAYPADGFHEQAPEDWQRALRLATGAALTAGGIHAADIVAIAVSGHSLGVVPIDRSGQLVIPSVPIWSDARGADAAAGFFERFDEDEWYRTTGCGFPPALYPIFKLGWFAEHVPDFLSSTSTVLGSKDWINYWLTGERATDPSYASGSGAVDIRAGEYSAAILNAARIDPAILPPIVASTAIIGELTTSAATTLGLTPGTPVCAGGVDNSCMSAGSLNTRADRFFLSLGSSSWAVVTTDAPIVDLSSRPYTFASLLPGLYDSALSSFSAGTSIDWVRATLFADVTPKDFIDLAQQSEAGAGGITFLPMLAGGSSIEGGPGARGELLGLDVRHSRADIARATIEGTVFAMARSFERLTGLAGRVDEVVVTGGGARDPWVRQLYADVLGVRVVSTDVEQQAAALGAAACAFVAVGLWQSVADLERAHSNLSIQDPDLAMHDRYREAMTRFGENLQNSIGGTPAVDENGSSAK